jgi:hypothetical protein
MIEGTASYDVYINQQADAKPGETIAEPTQRFVTLPDELSQAAVFARQRRVLTMVGAGLCAILAFLLVLALVHARRDRPPEKDRVVTAATHATPRASEAATAGRRPRLARLR